MISLLTICKPIGFVIICMNVTFPFLDKYWSDQRKLMKSNIVQSTQQNEIENSNLDDKNDNKTNNKKNNIPKFINR